MALQPLIVWFCLLLAFNGSACGALAGEKVIAAVLLASHGENPKPLPDPLGQACVRLQRVLNYNQFEILGSATNLMDEKEESWMVPTEHFWLRVKARRNVESRFSGGYGLNLELFHDKRLLVETDALLGVGSPLVLRGPLHARGQLLIVLMVIKE